MSAGQVRHCRLISSSDPAYLSSWNVRPSSMSRATVDDWAPKAVMHWSTTSATTSSGESAREREAVIACNRRVRSSAPSARLRASCSASYSLARSTAWAQRRASARSSSRSSPLRLRPGENVSTREPMARLSIISGVLAKLRPSGSGRAASSGKDCTSSSLDPANSDFPPAALSRTAVGGFARNSIQAPADCGIVFRAATVSKPLPFAASKTTSPLLAESASDAASSTISPTCESVTASDSAAVTDCRRSVRPTASSAARRVWRSAS